MKVSVQFLASFLIAAATVSAGPLGRRGDDSDLARRGGGCGYYLARRGGGNYGGYCRRGESPAAAAPSTFPKLTPSPTEGVVDLEAEEADADELEKRQNPNFNPKEGFIRGAQRSGANSTQIAFLQTVPEETYQKMFTMERKINQAFRALNNLTVPDLAALPTNNPNPRPRPPRPSGTGVPSKTRAPRPSGTAGARPRLSAKERFIKFATRKGVSADQLKAIQARPDSDFDFKNLSIKDTFVKENTLLGDNARVQFFSTTVPQALYDELTKLEDTVDNAFKSLKDGKTPTL
ncbi:hypothetical protein Dda_2841 [Drechslerella dactyloides]|uniref:Uncharacterized protein n=1 Tax=Drechslerella dactyloides TaxID=74499 RepID=A0AAD6J1S9_DREDA|nr:hypothetical protein Dda_2841 [Drechslerella dactyloides]